MKTGTEFLFFDSSNGNDHLEKIYMEFERKYNLKVEKIDVTSIKS